MSVSEVDDAGVLRLFCPNEECDELLGGPALPDVDDDDEPKGPPKPKKTK